MCKVFTKLTVVLLFCVQIGRVYASTSCADFLKTISVIDFEGKNEEIEVHSSIAGMSNVKPNSPLYSYYKKMIVDLKMENQFPIIRDTDLLLLEQLNNGGLGNKKIFIALFNGRKAIVKVSNERTRPESRVINEAKWLLLLNKLGFAAEFFGLYRNSEGDFGIVTQFINGEVFSDAKTPSDDIVIRQAMFYDISNLGKILNKIGAKYAPDMQFILTADGRAILIDPEYFSWEIPTIPPLDPKLVPFNPLENTQRLILKLEKKSAAHQSFNKNRQTFPASQILPSGIIVP